MKITNEEITYLIDIFEYMSNEPQNRMVVAALNELQELRAAKHERRWRKISEEKRLLCPFQITNGVEIHSFDKFTSDDDFIYLEELPIKATHWRPQDTSLPTEIEASS